MARTWIELPDEMIEECKIAASDDKTEPQDWYRRAILAALHPAPTLVTPPKSQGVLEDETADYLLGRLDPLKAQMVAIVARERRFRPFDFFLAAISNAVDQGEIAIGATARTLLQQDRAREVLPPSLEATCQWCHKTFTLQRPGQIYCPDPPDGSESCGRQAMKAEMQRMRDASRPPQPERRFAPPQPDPRLYLTRR